MITVKGKLQTPEGKPIEKAVIKITTLANSLQVLIGTTTEIMVTDGTYKFQLETGIYSVTVPQIQRNSLGKFVVTSTTPQGISLNELLYNEFTVNSEILDVLLCYLKDAQALLESSQDVNESLQTSLQQIQQSVETCQGNAEVTQEQVTTMRKLINNLPDLEQITSHIKKINPTGIGALYPTQSEKIILNDEDLLNLPAGSQLFVDVKSYNNSPLAEMEYAFLDKKANSDSDKGFAVVLHAAKSSKVFIGSVLSNDGVVNWSEVAYKQDLLPEAPKDGIAYARKDGSWVKVELDSTPEVIEELLIDIVKANSLKIGDKFTVSGDNAALKVVNGLDQDSETPTFAYAKYKLTNNKKSFDLEVTNRVYNNYSSDDFISTKLTLEYKIIAEGGQKLIAVHTIGADGEKDGDLNYFINFNFEAVEGSVYLSIPTVKPKYNDQTDYTQVSLPVKAAMASGWYSENNTVYGPTIFNEDPVCTLQMRELILRYSPSNGRTIVSNTGTRSDFIPVLFTPSGLFNKGHYLEYIHPLHAQYKAVVLTGVLTEDPVTPSCGITVKLQKVSDSNILDIKDVFNEMKASASGTQTVEKIIMYPILNVQGKARDNEAYNSIFEEVVS